jgi:hypothetical protein
MKEKQGAIDYSEITALRICWIGFQVVQSGLIGIDDCP